MDDAKDVIEDVHVVLVKEEVVVLGARVAFFGVGVVDTLYARLSQI